MIVCPDFGAAYLPSHLMADESGNLPVTPGRTMSSGVDLRRHSTGKASSGNADGKILPHYLRASTGSCHDFCKYGREHGFKVKEKRSTPKRVGRISLGQSAVESLDGKNKSVVKLRAALDSKPQISDTSDTNKQNLQSTESQKPVVHEVPVEETSVVKIGASLDSKPQISDTSETNKRDLQSKTENQKIVYEVPVKNTSERNLRKSLNSKPHISGTSNTNKLYFPSESPESQNQVVNEVQVKKTSSVKHRGSLDLKPHRTNKQEMQTKELDVKRKTAKQVPVKKTTMIKLTAPIRSMPLVSGASDSNKKEMTTKPPDSRNQVENGGPVNKKKASPSVHPKYHRPDLPKMLEQNISTTFAKVENLPKPASFKAEEMELSAERVTSSRSNSLTVKAKSSNNFLEGSSSQRNGELKTQKSAASSEPNITKSSSKVVKTSQTPSRASLSPKPSLNSISSINARKHRSLKVVSHLKNQSKTKKDEPSQHSNNEVEEKTLYVIEMENENRTSESDQNGNNDVDSACSKSLSSSKLLSSSMSQSSFQEYQEESEYTTSEEEEDSLVNNEMERMDVEALEAEEKGKPKKDGIICSEDEDFQMSRLKFRRGKVVESQSEKISPRRLKFRQGEVLGENANVKAESQKKSFNRRYGAVAVADSIGPEKIVLRHQDVQGKRDARGLFNNVIEETAGKLVETRKSKVKALVGAFETVISLQERKLPASTIS